jgi:hypothetical protein
MTLDEAIGKISRIGDVLFCFDEELVEGFYIIARGSGISIAPKYKPHVRHDGFGFLMNEDINDYGENPYLFYYASTEMDKKSTELRFRALEDSEELSINLYRSIRQMDGRYAKKADYIDAKELERRTSKGLISVIGPADEEGKVPRVGMR